MNRRVNASDFLNLSATLGKALIENNAIHLDGWATKRLLAKPAHRQNDGRITRIYTEQMMAGQLKADLETLKTEY